MKWGADLEDSQTPSKRNFLNSQENLNDGFQQLLQVGMISQLKIHHKQL